MARNTRIKSACGCILLPEALDILNPREVTCPDHGIQAVERKATFREIAETVYQIEFPLEPDEPPF